jgi:putative chitinase
LTHLANPGAFFAHLKAAQVLGPTLDQGEVDGLNAILAACGGAGWGPRFTAYALATADRETGGTMKPIKEWGGVQYFTRMYDVSGRDPARARKMGNTAPGDGARYCGRGYVQLTWKANYQKLGDLVGFPLVGNPDLAMRPDIAAEIMVKGMSRGLFTGKKLADYITADRCDFVNARRVINGTDHAKEIAREADHYLAALQAGGWA